MLQKWLNMSKNFVDKNCALDSAWLCLGGPSETWPGCDAVGYVYYGLSEGMEVIPNSFCRILWRSWLEFRLNLAHWRAECNLMKMTPCTCSGIVLYSARIASKIVLRKRIHHREWPTQQAWINKASLLGNKETCYLIKYHVVQMKKCLCFTEP